MNPLQKVMVSMVTIIISEVEGLKHGGNYTKYIYLWFCLKSFGILVAFHESVIISVNLNI